MATYTEYLESIRSDLFVEEDAARIYRGLKDMLVDEFDMDRIEEGKMEFNVSKPKDRIRLKAFKEKSPYTVIIYSCSFKAKPPRWTYGRERPDDILKARIKVGGEIVTVYPGGEPLSWVPEGQSQWPDKRFGETNLKADEKSRFEHSKLYKFLTDIWYNTFYQKQINIYKEEGDQTIKKIMNNLRQRFGVEETIRKPDTKHNKPPW